MTLETFVQLMVVPLTALCVTIILSGTLYLCILEIIDLVLKITRR